MRILSLLIVFSCFTSLCGWSQSTDEQQIRQILQQQTEAWNAGNLDQFMNGYWKSDSLMFIGQSGVTYGWQQTLDNYRRGYPDRREMGILSFQILKVERLSTDHFFVVGRWHLKREVGDLSGHYTLLWRKINGSWVIVADHSS